jgi:hypothetical protein
MHFHVYIRNSTIERKSNNVRECSSNIGEDVGVSGVSVGQDTKKTSKEEQVEREILVSNNNILQPCIRYPQIFTFTDSFLIYFFLN